MDFIAFIESFIPKPVLLFIPSPLLSLLLLPPVMSRPSSAIASRSMSFSFAFADFSALALSLSLASFMRQNMASLGPTPSSALLCPLPPDVATL